MGNVCITESSRHANTRQTHLLAQQNSRENEIDFIIGANSDVTTAIDAHRQSLRDQGLVQPPAHSETIQAIQCPINLRKDSIRLINESAGKDGEQNSTDEEPSYSIVCSLDIEVSSLLEVSVLRQQQRVLRRLVRINETGMGVNAIVKIAPEEETKQTELESVKDNQFHRLLGQRAAPSRLCPGDIIEFKLVPIEDTSSTPSDKQGVLLRQITLCKVITFNRQPILKVIKQVYSIQGQRCSPEADGDHTSSITKMKSDYKNTTSLHDTEFEVDQIYDSESQSKSDCAGEDSDRHCVVCYSRHKDTICLPCRHLCICKACSEIIKHMDAESNMRNRCPLCRSMASSFIHIDNNSATAAEGSTEQLQSSETTGTI